MPPTNYIWMKTDTNGELIGVFTWLNGDWHEIHIDELITKTEASEMINALVQEFIADVINGEYDLTSSISIDSELNSSSTNPIGNNVVTEELNRKLNRSEFDISPISVEDYPWLENSINYAIFRFNRGTIFVKYNKSQNRKFKNNCFW